ncbi:hypothetical protein D9M68_962650 [compost metagenome]
MFDLASCWSKLARLARTASIGSTFSESPCKGRRQSSRSRTQADMRSTWVMMSSMHLRACGPSISCASSALERIDASGLRRLWATAEDISPNPT